MGEPTEGVQVSLVQLDNYGPWTVTPSPRREMDLQALQARLYADVAAFVGERDGYAFFDRFDNMFAVTNGVDGRDHARLQRRIRNRFPVTVSVGVGREPTPVAALGTASRRVDLQVGVGRGTTARAAGHRAKVALEQCRESGNRVRRAGEHATTD